MRPPQTPSDLEDLLPGASANLQIELIGLGGICAPLLARGWVRRGLVPRPALGPYLPLAS